MVELTIGTPRFVLLYALAGLGSSLAVILLYRHSDSPFIGASGAVYNVCSGTAYSMQSVLDDLMALAGIAVEVVVDPSLLRPVETPRLIGDASRVQRDTGWRPEIGFERTLRDMLAYYA